MISSWETRICSCTEFKFSGVNQLRTRRRWKTWEQIAVQSSLSEVAALVQILAQSNFRFCTDMGLKKTQKGNNMKSHYEKLMLVQG